MARRKIGGPQKRKYAYPQPPGEKKHKGYLKYKKEGNEAGRKKNRIRPK